MTLPASGQKWLDTLGTMRAAIAELAAERDRYRDALVARHGGEPLALLSELDAARAERDAAVAKCAELERIAEQARRDGQEISAGLHERIAELGRELAAAKGKLAGLCRNLRDVHARIEAGIREHGSEGCEVFATLLELHELGPAAIAAAEHGGA